MSLNKNKAIASSLILCVLLGGCGDTSPSVTVQQQPVYAYKYENTQIVRPFWESDVVYNETVLMIKDGENLPQGKLLFNATKIISVRDSTLKKEYVDGQDYTYADGIITLVQGAKVPYLTTAQLHGDNLPSNITPMVSAKTDTKKILFTETAYVFERQLAVTYSYNNKDWVGPVPVFSADKLPKTIEKLKTGKDLKIVVFGDSIAAGGNSSKVFGIAPFTPTWGELLKIGLEEKYDSTVAVINNSVGGKVSQWGVENAKSLVGGQKPDLAVISFGMNDGTGKVPADEFAHNIQLIINTIKSESPETEFILVAPMLANPESDYAGNQREYGAELDKMQAVGISIVDMGAMHEEFLKRKHYSSMTANNINHPNDFLARAYAMSILSLLVEY